MLDKYLNKLERKFGRFAIPDLMLYVVLGMGLIYVFDLVVSMNPNRTMALSPFLEFDRDLILHGQIWRVITFLLVPGFDNPVFTALALYFFWMLGTGLERAWGTFKFNVYFFLGALGCILAGFIVGRATNTYHYMSIFLAFAILYPNYEILLFFIIPVKMKWLGMIDGALLLILFITGDMTQKVFLLLSLINLVVFFGKSFFDRIYYTIRRYYYKWFKKL